MKRNITPRLIAAAAALVLIVGTTASFVQAQSGYTFRIENSSEYAIYQIRMSSVDDSNWRQDLLGDSALPSGYHVTLPRTYLPGFYDLKLVDEDGDVCIVPSVRVSGNTVWDVTDAWLLNCEFH